MATKKRPPLPLQIDAPVHQHSLHVARGDDDDPPEPLSARPRSLRNLKKLSLTLPAPDPALHPERPRRPSVMSLPSPAVPTALSAHYRKDESDDHDSAPPPYSDGPIQVIPGVWLGSEDNARDWKGLMERGIKSVLNVAKEVASPFDPILVQPLRAVASTPDFKHPRTSVSTYIPAHLATGRPAMHYLKLQWSHGQQDLVHVGFPAAMAFTDAAARRGEGVLVHCQCGVSRSATLVIAMVMRAAVERSSTVPSEIWELKGMQEVYSFVKDKSKWVSPNMSLIYQLLEYEKKLKAESASPSDSEKSSVYGEEEEWSRQRRLFDDALPNPEDDRESTIVMREAQALDKAMEDRVVARQSSISSLASASTNSGVGMGAAWRNRYGATRKRAASVASNRTNVSVLSEDLVEEEEEEDLLGIHRSFDGHRRLSLSPETEESSADNSPDENSTKIPPQRAHSFTPTTLVRPPPAPARKSSFHMPPSASTRSSAFDFSLPPKSAVRSTFHVSICPPLSQSKRRPAPIGILPPVPPSPVAIVVESPLSTGPTISKPPASPSDPNSKHTTDLLAIPPVRVRTRTKSKKPEPPPVHLLKKASQAPHSEQATDNSMPAPTPAHSQTFFVFPPSPTTSTLTARTPSAMTLTSSSVLFPSLATPRVSTFRSQAGRTRSFIGIGLGVPPAPTTGFSRVDARGYVGLR